MAWDGYFQYAGTEIVNVARTEAYAKAAGATWFRPVFKAEALPFMLGDGLNYRTALIDDAPWVDPDFPESLDFYGFYPLDVSGIEDSTRTSTVTESLGDGGTPGRIRNATKSLVFNGLILAGNEASAEYGMKWLKQALMGGACGTSIAGACNGEDLCYLSSEPDMEIPRPNEAGVRAMFDGGYSVQQADGTWVPIEVDTPDVNGGDADDLPEYEFDGGSAATTGDFFSGRAFPFNTQPFVNEQIDPEECLSPYVRSLRRVIFNNGPQRTSKRQTSDGGAVWAVQFTGVAGSPYELGGEKPVIAGFMDPEIEVPWADGADPQDAIIDMDGFIYEDQQCSLPVSTPIFDPLYPALIAPPSVPSVPLGNYSPPLNWHRRQFTVPKQYVPLWGEVVPKISVSARTGDLRNLRLRFYADPFGLGSIEDDPCAFCGDLVISYVPVDHTLVMDGSDQTVYVVSPGGVKRRADSLVFRTDGTPFDWPTLSCGFGFIVTLDLPQTQEPPVVDLSLFSRSL